MIVDDETIGVYVFIGIGDEIWVVELGDGCDEGYHVQEEAIPGMIGVCFSRAHLSRNDSHTSTSPTTTS